jgi:elongation factor Ts
VDGTRGAVVEVNSETEFVARNEQFQETVRKIATLALDAGGDFDALKAAEYTGGKSVEEYLKELVGTIGENMNLRRTAYLQVGSGVIASYMHNAAADGLGKIGVLVALESNGDKQVLASFGKQLAMHVAAANPQALSSDSLDPALVESERNILIEQARESGKPENIIEKMVEGRLRKFFEEVALLSQTFVVDGETRIAKAVEAAAKEAGADIEVTGFLRFALGEGIEKKSEDFAAEVAAAAGS